jgi:hypothetical protein
MSTPKESHHREEHSSNDGYEYLKDLYPPQNIDLGKFVFNLYN